MLNKQCEVNKTDIKLQTPLMAAAAGGGAEIISALIDFGANIDAQNCEGVTALMMASFYGHYDSVHELLQAGANADLHDKKNKTALHYATDQRQIEIAEFLSQWQSVAGSGREIRQTPDA